MATNSEEWIARAKRGECLVYFMRLTGGCMKLQLASYTMKIYEDDERLISRNWQGEVTYPFTSGLSVVMFLEFDIGSSSDDTIAC